MSDIHEAATPADASSVTIMVEGGELCCSDSMKPSDVIAYTIASAQARAVDLVTPKILLPPDGHLACKEPVPMERVSAFVARVEHELRQTRGSVIALVTSSKLGRYGTALAIGLQPEDLVGTQRSLLLTTAKKRFQDDPQLSIETMQHALELSRDPQMHGRMGGLLGHEVWPLPGLAVSSNNGAYSRYHQPIAEYEDKQWMIIWPRAEHRPVGKPGEFGLVSGVRTHAFAEDPDEFFLGPITPDERAMVLKTRIPGDPFTAIPVNVLREIDAVNLPAVLVREYTQGQQPPSPEAMLYRNIIDGGSLFSGEAKVVLSHALFLADRQKITQPEEVIAFVRQRFTNYQFR